MNETRRVCYVLPACGNLPRRKMDAITLGFGATTCAELAQSTGTSSRGDLNLLILLGSHGLGKSQVVRQATTRQACWLEGNTSPFGLYCQLWHNQNRAV